jgi:hypothetical protein
MDKQKETKMTIIIEVEGGRVTKVIADNLVRVLVRDRDGEQVGEKTKLEEEVETETLSGKAMDELLKKNGMQ